MARADIYEMSMRLHARRCVFGAERRSFYVVCCVAPLPKTHMNLCDIHQQVYAPTRSQLWKCARPLLHRVQGRSILCREPITPMTKTICDQNMLEHIVWLWDLGLRVLFPSSPDWGSCWLAIYIYILVRTRAYPCTWARAQALGLGPGPPPI